MASFRDRLIAAAHAAIDRLFTRAKVRLGLVKTPKGDKRLTVRVDPASTLPGLFESAAREQGVVPRRTAVEEVRKVADGYLSAQAEAAKAAMARTVGQIVSGSKGVMTASVKKELETSIDHVLNRTAVAVNRIAETEATAARNLAGLEAVSAVNVAAGVDDPTVFWITSRDNDVCDECTKLHLLPDGITPRVWKLSQAGRGYHVRGQDIPSVLGIHPSCRCTLATLLPNYGFGSDGTVRFIAFGHDEFKIRHG